MLACIRNNELCMFNGVSFVWWPPNCSSVGLGHGGWGRPTLLTCKLGFKTIEFCSKKLAALGHWGRAEGPHLGGFSALQQRGRAEGSHLENFGPCGSGAGPKARTGGGVGPLQGQGPKASTPSTTAKPRRIAHPAPHAPTGGRWAHIAK